MSCRSRRGCGESISLTGQFGKADWTRSSRVGEPDHDRRTTAREGRGQGGRTICSDDFGLAGGPAPGWRPTRAASAPSPRPRHEPHRTRGSIFLDEPERAAVASTRSGRIEVWQVSPEPCGQRHATVFLTTQWHDEAEKLGPTGSRSCTRRDHRVRHSRGAPEAAPPAKVEYTMERQPTLEEIFLAIVGSDKKEQ